MLFAVVGCDRTAVMGRWVEEAKDPALSLQLIETEELSWRFLFFSYPFT
jgi:hypothetical protein